MSRTIRVLPVYTTVPGVVPFHINGGFISHAGLIFTSGLYMLHAVHKL
jgi:hypothetical protein